MLESGHRGKLAYGNWAYGIRACGLLAYGILAYLYKGHIHLEYQGCKQGRPRGHPSPIGYFSKGTLKQYDAYKFHIKSVSKRKANDSSSGNNTSVSDLSLLEKSALAAKAPTTKIGKICF